MKAGLPLAGLTIAAMIAAAWHWFPATRAQVAPPSAAAAVSSLPVPTLPPTVAKQPGITQKPETTPPPARDPRTVALGTLRESFYAAQPYPLYVALRDSSDPASRVAARYLRASCLSALHRLSRVQAQPSAMTAPSAPAFLREQAGHELLLRCQAIKDDTHQAGGPPPASDAPEIQNKPLPAAERLRRALDLGDFVNLMPAIHDHLRVHPYFEGQLLGGARSPEVFEAALELAFHQLHQVPGEHRAHLSQLIDCAVNGRCDSSGISPRSSQGLPFDDPELRSLAQRLQTAIEHRTMAPFLAGPGA